MGKEASKMSFESKMAKEWLDSLSPEERADEVLILTAIKKVRER